MPNSNVNSRLKLFLLEIVEHDKEEEAWEYFKTLDWTLDDVYKLVVKTPIHPFTVKAWELYKQKEGTIEDFVSVIKNAGNPKIKTEAEEILMERFTPDNSILQEIVQSNQSNAASKLLLSRNPNKEQLLIILEHSQFSDPAAQELLKTNLDIDDLHEIIRYSSFKKEAWKLFLEKDPTMDQIRDIIHYTDLEDMAWEFLLTQSPANEELKDFIHDYTETDRKRSEAGYFILSNDPSVEDLTDLIQNDLYTSEAWVELKKKKLSEEDTNYITWRLIRQEPKWKNEAAKLCLSFGCDEEVLWDIIRYTPYKDEAAEKLILKGKLNVYQLEEIIVESTIGPVVNELSKRVGFDRSQVNETELIQEIKSKILNNPELLDVNNWHNQERHSFGGWAIELNKHAQEIEKKYSSDIAASITIPSYRHLIFADRETVLSELKKI